MATPFFHVDVQQPAEMRFNRARVRRAFVTIGQRHMRDARRLVMRRARSAPGENPGYQTGRLARSIGYMVPRASKKRAGFMTRIAPNQRNGKGNRMISGDFYPAFLFFGVRGGAKRRRSHHRGASGGSGWRLAPRNNFMVETLEKNRSPYFENRVAGAAQFKNLPEVGKLRLPAAYVVPGDDSPGENKSQTDYWQELKEGFSVVVILSNGRDERGQFASYDVVDDVRQMLFKALLGWNPEACGNPITYDGGTLLDLNRHELIYQFDFSVISELTEDDTRQQDDLNSLDELQTLAIDVDYLDPGNGPDGDIEHHTEITLPS